MRKAARICSVCLTLAASLHSTSVNLHAQAPTQTAPLETLRDVLMAACSQDARKFGANLTARNASAFARMTPAAQAALLKRFVLLNDPGAPRAEVTADGITVFCVTPQLTSQMEIGQPEVHDNLAYLPLIVKNATDDTDSTAKHVVMGLVRENGQWKLLSLGVLLLDLPTLAEEWDKAEIQTNERSALASIKELVVAIEKYRFTYTHLPQTLSELGPPSKGAPKSEQAGLVSADLANGRKDGYIFRYVIVGANDSGAPAKYQLAAIPLNYGRTGTRSFFRDESGILHAADHQGAVGTQLDPKLD